MTHPHPSTDVTGEKVRDTLSFIEKLNGKEIVELENAIDEALTTQATTHQATLAEVVKAMLTSDKLYGFQIVVTKDLNDKRYIAGFEAGKEFMKDRIKAIAAKHSITLTDVIPPTI